ncbi:kinase-like domain-containing protein [Mycena floridula]|nr:kinase-like domain-containing protein [Mycena floridula]
MSLTDDSDLSTSGSTIPPHTLIQETLKDSLSRLARNFVLNTLYSRDEALALPSLSLLNATVLDATALSTIYRGTMARETVVAKVLRARRGEEGSASRQVLAEFIKEASIWNAAKHARVLTLSGIANLSQDHDVSQMAMISPFMEEGTISEYLKIHPTANKLMLLCDVANALEFIHGLDPPILHGDVKGSNILIDKNGRALLSDFGVAEILKSETVVKSGSRLGTLRWMAPEAITPDEVITLKADVYSFGCFCIEVFTQKRPFDDIVHEGGIILQVAINRLQPSRPTTLSSGSPHEDFIWAMMQTCFRYKASARPTMSQIHRDLLLVV